MGAERASVETPAGVAPPTLPPGLRAKFESARAQLRGDRREVVVLFADLMGYTALSERLDPEEVTLLLNPLLQRLAGAVYAYEGYVDKFMGDAVMALFGAPLAHENDAERAVLAGLAMLDEIVDHNRGGEAQLALRVGINLGEVVAAHLGSEMRLQYTVLGDTVNVASRLETAAEPNTILVSGAVHRRIAKRFEAVELPPLRVRGKSEPLEAFRIVRYAGAGPRAVSTRARFVGREQELSVLQAFLDRARTGRGGALLIEAEAGIGKSRLAAEALARAGMPPLTLGLSPIHLPGERAPEIELFAQLMADGEGSSVERAGELLGAAFPAHRLGIEGLAQERGEDGGEPGSIAADDPETARQNRWLALAALLRAAGRRRPIALLVEDLHWADEAARDFLDFLLPALTNDPIPIVLTSRPAPDVEGPKTVERFAIGPLDEAAAQDLLVGLGDLAPEDRRDLIRRSQGNPLFIEELVRAMTDVGEEGRRSVPGTVQGLIMARIDRLEPPLQLLLQMAAVLGARFPTPLLARMYALESQPIGFDSALVALKDRGFLEERGQDEHGFRHALIQEVAYRGLLQRVRKVLHESAGRLGEEFFTDRHESEAAFFAHHYWHAGLPAEAAPYLWIAGRTAAAGYDLPTAERYLRRAARAIEMDSEILSDAAERARFAETLGDVLLQRGHLEEAETWFQWLEEHGRAEGVPTWEARGLERRGRVTWYRGDLEGAARFFEAGLEVLPEDEPLVAADMHNGLGIVHYYQGAVEEAFDQLSRALKLREEHRDTRGVSKSLLNLGNLFIDRLDDLESAERHYRRAYRTAESIGDRMMLYSALNNLGRVEIRRGEWHAALDTLDRAERLLEDIGWSFARYVTLQNRVDCEIALGRLDDALRHLQTCLDKGDAVLEPVNRITTRVYLFDLYLRMHDDREAQRALEEAWRVIQECGVPEEAHEVRLREGRLLAARGRWEEAAQAFARAEEEARRYANPEQAVLASAQRRRALVRSGRPAPVPASSREASSLPYSTLVRYLDADAEAALQASPAAAEVLGQVADQAARMGIHSLERASAERQADVLRALGDHRSERIARMRALRALHALARNLPLARREAFLEHPRNAALRARAASSAAAETVEARSLKEES